MPKGTPQQAAEKWARRGQAATQDYLAGIQAVTVSPGERAAQAQDRMLSGIQEAITSGRWGNAVRAVTLTDWKSITAAKGQTRFAAGIAAAQGKMASKMVNLFAALSNAEASIASIPPTTFEQRMQRMVQFSTAMHAQKGKI